MAYVEKYVTDAGAGTADGSSLANAWSWATMLTTLASGQRANVQGAITRTTNTDVFTNNGTTAAPISVRGINASLGDLEANGVTRGGAPITTNFPVITYTTGKVTWPTFCVQEHLAGTGAPTAGTSFAGAANGFMRRCDFRNTHATNSTASGATASSPSFTEECFFSIASSNAAAFAFTMGGRAARIVATAGSAGGGGISITATGSLTHCMIRDVAAGISITALANIEGCSFRNVSGNAIANGSTANITNCVAWLANGGKWYNSTGSVRQHFQNFNAVGCAGTPAADTNAGDWPVDNQITLTSDPFTSSTDLSLNNTSGGGLACQGTANFAYLDGGAWQVQATPPAGGLGAGTGRSAPRGTF